MATRVWKCGHSKTVHSSRSSMRYFISAPCPACIRQAKPVQCVEFFMAGNVRVDIVMKERDDELVRRVRSKREG